MRVVFELLCLAILSLSVNYINGEVKECNEGLGVCTSYSGCSNATDFHHGDDQINVRFNLEDEPCHYLEMCCDPEDVVPDFVETYPNNENTVQIDSESQIQESTTVANNFFESRGEDETTEKVKPELNTGEEHTIDESTVQPFQSHAGGILPGTPENSCDNDDHECIPFFYCSEDHTTDGAGEFSMRVGGNAGCLIQSQVCCNRKNNILRMKPTVCGLRNKDGIGFQVTNSVDEAQYAEFPWMAALHKVNEELDNAVYICGGSLIHPYVVLTAAHCVNNVDPGRLMVRLGEWDSQTTKEIMPHSDHYVNEVIVHPEFGPANVINDYALLVLKNPVELKIHINTICLPPKNFKINGNCFASGWGADEFGNDKLYRVNLKKVELPVVPLKDCQDALRTTKLGPRFKIHTNFMCAGGEQGVDTCTGDGGSPLVCPVPGKEEIYYQTGIVSWGIECNQPGIPGVYANVIKARDWIDGLMNEWGYGTQSYTLE